MSKTYIWRPKEFKTGPVEGLDLAYPVGIDDVMYFKTEEDEEGNVIFDQVGKIVWPDPSNKKVYEVNYDPQFDGPRENESAESKAAREEYVREHPPEGEQPEAGAESTAPAQEPLIPTATPTAEAGGEATGDGTTN
jgi:hypothetical protein